MRIFENFPEAFGEISRDLREMGIYVKNEKMQDKAGSFPTYELYNYGYTVIDPQFDDLSPVQPWADAEWQERQNGIESNALNPGLAWQLRDDENMIWADYLEVGGTPLPAGVTVEQYLEKHPESFHDPQVFAYTYAERFAIKQQVWQIIRELRRNIHSRQLFVSLWDPHQDCECLGRRRVPCSLGWHFMYRNDALHITYFMRSCDFHTHFQNDVFLSLKLLRYVADAAGVQMGRFSQFINSFHVYEKDVKDVF